MKTCENTIGRTGKPCGRKLCVQISVIGDIHWPDVSVNYHCPIHRWAWTPKGMPNDSYDLETMLQEMLDK